MYSQTYNIAPYVPALNAEQTGKKAGQLAVHDGENFIWNLRGVQSGFGITETLPDRAPDQAHPAVFDVANVKYYFKAGEVYKQSGATWQTVFTFAASQTSAKYDLDVYEWSTAFVGSRHWFCHPLVNELVFYDEFDKQWGTFRDEDWLGPLFGITQADNRLVVLLRDIVTWSHFDRGDLFSLGWQCGSGVQSLSLVHYGQPYAVMPYNNGWLTYTSKGIMTSRPDFSQTLDPDGRKVVAGALVFKHAVTSHENLPLGPTAITHIDNKQNIWLSQSGFWQFAPAQGGGFGAVQLWQGEMGRFYAETVVPHLTRTGMELDAIKLQWAADLQWMFVSSRSSFAKQYERAHVFQLVLDRWACFNEAHVTIGSGRDDNEVFVQVVNQRFFGIITAAGSYSRIDLRSASGRSWIKFSPMRLQIPDENVTAETITSVQGVRVGHSHPVWDVAKVAGLQSSFAAAEDTEHAPSKFKLLISSADGYDETLGDEQAYGALVNKSKKVSQYALHTTGVAHTLIITALDQSETFDIQHIEIDYFWAGIK